MRLNKYIASCGVASRREADRIIESGRVTINGLPGNIGSSVDDGMEVRIDGQLIKPLNKKVVFALYKPVGYVVTENDIHAEKTVFDLIDYPERLTYAGRLDKDSEGLILLTNDGELINACMKGINSHEKEYFVTVDRELSEKAIEEFTLGIYLKELDKRTRPCKIFPAGKNAYRVIITQGMNRQIRRMFSYFGLNVRKLKRVRVVNVNLGQLKPGQYRELDEEEMINLYSSVGMEYKA